MGIQEDRLPAPCQCLGSKLQDIQLALGAETEEAAIRAASGREGLKVLSSTLADKNLPADSAGDWHHEGRCGSSGYCHPLGSSVASLLLPAGDLCAQGFPRVAATHFWTSRVRARLPSSGELQRVLPAVPRHALGRRHLFPRRRRSPVRTVLPVCAPPLLPGIRALGAAQAGSSVRERARALAAGGDGRAGFAGPLPPRHATSSALQKTSGPPADGLRRRTYESALLEKSLEQNAGVPASESQFLIKVPTTVPPMFSGSEKVAYQGPHPPT